MRKLWAGIAALGAMLTMAAGPAGEVMGDFDGNGVPDVARVSIGPNGYQVTINDRVVSSGPIERAGEQLNVKPPGFYKSIDGDSAHAIHEVLVFTNAQGGETLIYWSGGRYHSITTKF
jgi:hypothetical protein